jgi:hypothetical protein
MQNVQFVDFFNFGPGNAPAQGFFTDFVEQLFATGFGEFFSSR